MRAADLPRVMLNELRAYPFPWDEAVFHDCLAGRYDAFVLHEANGKDLAGHFVLQHVLDEAHLLNLCIAPERQGQGLGRFLLHAAMSQACLAQAASFYLEVRASNDVARRLYLSEGFTEIGRRKGYYPAADGREDGLVMVREL